MFEKDVKELSLLLDFYGELLPERKRSVLDMYYNEDFSLSEIADEIGISRQGVRNIIKKSESELFFYEEKLGLAKKLLTVEKYSASLCELASKNRLPDDLTNEILQLAEAIKQ